MISVNPHNLVTQHDPVSTKLLDSTRKENTGRMLLQVYRTITESGTAELRRRGHCEINITHAIILPYVDLEGTRLSVLAERVGVTKQSMTQLVQELERHGYLSRKTDLSDKRAQVIMITELGWQLLSDIYHMKQMMETSIDRLLGSANANTLRILLSRMAKEYAGYGEHLNTVEYDDDSDDSAISSSNGKQTTINFSGHSSIYHTGGESIFLNGSGNNITLRNTCPHLQINGNGNNIVVDSVGSVMVNGSGNTITWNSAIEGNLPQIVVQHGNGNEFSQR